jgi:hypothetical protein
MSLGVHFALSAADEARLLAAKTDDDVVTIVEEIEERAHTEPHCDTDTAWDAIHRALTDGKLEYGNGTFPLNAVILGGRMLVSELPYTVSYVAADQVVAIAEADHRGEVSRPLLRPDEAGINRQRDDRVHWGESAGPAGFYAQAARAGRAVIFTWTQVWVPGCRPALARADAGPGVGPGPDVAAWSLRRPARTTPRDVLAPVRCAVW